MISNSFSFKNRIAFYYIITTAFLILSVFFTIHYAVKQLVYRHLDDDIKAEVSKLYNYIKVTPDKIILINEKEWKEQEHTTEDVNPIFVEFLDINGTIFDKSPNLKNDNLPYGMFIKENQIFNAELNGKAVRQIKVPLFYKTKKVGYMQVAVSGASSKYIIDILNNILLISFPLILAVLFITARFFAGKSIKPIEEVIATSNLISKDNLSTRVNLPNNKDEIYTLSQTINNLLDRIESAIQREKQFTSDASHELRTPLAVLKGTLEVLIRKPRNVQEYNEKISFCIKEINRMNTMVDQLLLLARLENHKQSLEIQSINLNSIVTDVLSMNNYEITLKNIKVIEDYHQEFFVNSNLNFLSIIINNLIANSIKYSHTNSSIIISIFQKNNNTFFEITDYGIGIPKEELSKIFHSFYRTNHSMQIESSSGNGLGLSIVKRLCDLLRIDLKVSSKINKETRFTLQF